MDAGGFVEVKSLTSGPVDQTYGIVGLSFILEFKLPPSSAFRARESELERSALSAVSAS